MQNHTPGPWMDDELDVSIDLWDTPVAVISGADNNIVAFVPREDIGNAPLIGAAPDMLTALRQWLVECPTSEDPIERDRLNMALALTRAAIEQAEGTTNA